MQWSHLTNCNFSIYTSTPVYTLLPSVSQCLDSCGKALILILEKVLNCRQFMTISSVRCCSPAKWFFMLGNRNSHILPNQENMEGDQPVQSHSHAQQSLQLLSQPMNFSAHLRNYQLTLIPLGYFEDLSPLGGGGAPSDLGN